MRKCLFVTPVKMGLKAHSLQANLVFLSISQVTHTHTCAHTHTHTHTRTVCIFSYKERQYKSSLTKCHFKREKSYTAQTVLSPQFLNHGNKAQAMMRFFFFFTSTGHQL